MSTSLCLEPFILLKGDLNLLYDELCENVLKRNALKTYPLTI